MRNSEPSVQWVSHGSCALRLRSRITTRSHFISLLFVCRALSQRPIGEDVFTLIIVVLLACDSRFIAAHFSSVPFILEERLSG